jgi:hypothetical protein
MSTIHMHQTLGVCAAWPVEAVLCQSTGQPRTGELRIEGQRSDSRHRRDGKYRRHSSHGLPNLRQQPASGVS